jgi:hypothetical protein
MPHATAAVGLFVMPTDNLARPAFRLWFSGNVRNQKFFVPKAFGVR